MQLPSQESALRTIGKYEIVAKIADGSTGSIYKGRDPLTGEVVAIKFAADELVRDAVLVKRFEQEFRSASSIDHPNIVRGLDFGWQKSKPFMVMEFIDGEDMWARIERLGRLPEAEAVGYLIEVAQGLHQAHKQGIIHRDIKPDNVLLTADGHAKLADLGLCKDLETADELTRPNKGLGTPNFIAPEQFGDAKHAGVRCDVYSLGATLYMALTGVMPFQGRSLAAILKKKLADDLTPPRELVPTLSEHVDWAVRRAALVDPERRFASCLEFIAALTPGNGSASPAPWKVSSPGGRSAKREKRFPEERRASVRYDCPVQTSCSNNPSVHPEVTDSLSPWDAHLCNLSLVGIGMILARRFEPGSVLSVDLQSSDGEVKRTLEMRVVRVLRADGGQWYIGGILSKKLSKEELRRLLP